MEKNKTKRHNSCCIGTLMFNIVKCWTFGLKNNNVSFLWHRSIFPLNFPLDSELIEIFVMSLMLS